MENQPKRKTCRGVPFRCVVRCSAERKLTFLLAGRQWSLQCINKVLMKAQPTELIFSFPVTAVSERNQVSFLCSSGRWTTCSILFLLFVWKSKGTILRDIADSVCFNRSSLWGNLPWGCTRRLVLWDICKGKSRQTVALLARVGWRKSCCNTHQHSDLEEVKQGKNFQNISAHNRYNQGPLGFSQVLEQLRCFTPAYWKFLSFSAASELVSLFDHLSIMYPQMPRAKWERDGPRNPP